MAKTEKTGLKFAVLADLHYAVDGEDAEFKMLKSGSRVLPALLERLSGDDELDFVLFNGDLFADPHYHHRDRLMDVLSKNLSKPYFVLPGNHDRRIYKNTGVTFDLAEFVSTFRGRPYADDATQSWWGIDVNGYHLVGLDSSREDSWGGRLTREQLGWLESDLGEHRDRFTVLFIHHPVIEFHPGLCIRREHFLEYSDDLEDILRTNAQVKFVVAGHVHLPSARLKDGVHHFTVPSLVTYPCRYAVFSIEGDTVTFSTEGLGDGGLVERARGEVLKTRSWRDAFGSDAEMISLFDGPLVYSFRPR